MQIAATQLSRKTNVNLLLVKGRVFSVNPFHLGSRGPFSVECPIICTILFQAQKVHLFKVTNYRGFLHVNNTFTDLTVEQSSLVKGTIILHTQLVLSIHVSFNTGHPQLCITDFAMEFSLWYA